ncbi:hypothetical protein BGZ76_005260 [Entomortierella beljakovae]|nr:hypothetical protein BGZ76_005260 [Entomortierella beljakovae]
MATTRACYWALKPIRAVICIATLYSFVSVSIGKKLGQDTMSSSLYDDPSDINAYATQDFFDDSAHFGINITALINTLIIIFYPHASFWWLRSAFRRMTFALVLASLAQCYGIKLLVEILDKGGCSSDPFFSKTRARCWIQYGVTGCEILWSILLILESFISSRQQRDVKWQEQTAEVELQNAVVYRPDLSLEAGGGVLSSNNNNNNNSSNNNDDDDDDDVELGIRRNHDNEQSIAQSGYVEEDQLPQYTRRRPRDQPRIIDAANPPQRLAGAVARQIHLEETSNSIPLDVSDTTIPYNDLPSSSSLSPSSSSPSSSSTTASTTTATATTTTHIPFNQQDQVPQVPPPSYQP